jgi:hypothetical protein
VPGPHLDRAPRQKLVRHADVTQNLRYAALHLMFGFFDSRYWLPDCHVAPCT